MDTFSPVGLAFLAWALILLLGGTLIVIWPRPLRRRRCRRRRKRSIDKRRKERLG